MATDNGSSRRLVAMASPAIAGIAIVAGCFSLASGDALSVETFRHRRSNHVASASHPHTSQAPQPFSPAQPHPQQLAIRKAKPTNASHRLRVHNICPQTIEIAVRYQDPQQAWVTQGWLNVPGRSSRYLTSASSQVLGLSQRVMYYYAKALQSDLVWSGNGSHQYLLEQQVLNMRIHYAAVDVLGDYSLFILCNEGE